MIGNDNDEQNTKNLLFLMIGNDYDEQNTKNLLFKTQIYRTNYEINKSNLKIEQK